MKYYLGISCYFHDSSIALLNENGDLIDFKKEEYFSRVKGDKSFPRLALEEIINNFNLDDKSILKVTFYEKPFKAWLNILKYSIKNNSLSNELTRNYFKNIWKSSIIFSYDLSKYLKVSNQKIIYCDHHLSHTLSGAYYNQKTPITSIVIDGYGDESTSSIHHIKSSKEINNVWSSSFPHSIGLFYSAITDYLGFSVNEGEYKVMGLAAYGEPIYYDELKKTINFVDGKLNLDDSYYDFCRSVSRSYSDKLNEIFNIGERESNQNLDLDTPNFKQYANIASSAQKIVENLLKKIFLYAHEITKEKRFIFAGGVAMNSVAINELSKLDFVEEIIIPPSPGDSGAALGAAYYGYLKNGNEFLTNNNDIDILSPGLVKNKNTDEEFFLTNYDKICDHNNLIETASELIISNEVIATCYKNIETGPRALGHRSMICNAHSLEAVNFLNEKIKKRSKFRPVAPVTLLNNASKYFLLSDKIHQSYFYMGSVVNVKNSNGIEAVVHNDNTARVQICDENHILGKILKKLEKKNIFVIANTSFNISSDPMVYSLEDAYLALERMNIKYLMTENGIYKKKMMNKLFKILVFVLAIEIILGYVIYFRGSTLISGNYVSSTLRFIDKIIRFTKPITDDYKEKKKIREINKIDCKKFEEKNQILNISGFNSFRKPIKFQSNLNFLNTFDQEKDFLIVIQGNSETFGWYQKDEDRLHSLLQKKLREKINTKNIFVLNLSYAGGMISDHLTDTLNFSEIYHPDLVIFYTGGNELHLRQTYKDILDNYSLNMENFKLYSFEKKNDHNSTALLFPNTLQKCLSDSLYLTEEKFKKINQNINVETYIKKNFEKINISLKNRSIDFLFYIQPFNKEISKSKKITENYKKITSLSIPDKSFKNLNLIDKKIKINYVDLFHTLDTNNTSNYLANDILIKFEETIKDKIINENN